MAQNGATKANERALAFANVTELTGEDEHEKLTELEVIFGPFDGVDAHALRRCANLQKLTLMCCRLERLPILALHAVRESLVHLCLASQLISRMEPLDLPQLRSLYLQQNRIERIEGLDRCRRLQVLWLSGNCVQKIENLGNCGDLRELWLQDNAISSLCGTDSDAAVGDLVNLQTLCLAKNRIRGIDELQALRKLINLRVLSFADDHFGSNPIVRHPEYRPLAITTVRQLQRLDGVAVTDTERAMAVDHFLSETIAFNDKIAALELEYQQQVRAIRTRQQRSESNAAMLQRELVEALNQVEHSVVTGMNDLELHRQQQLRRREQLTKSTVASLDALRDAYVCQLRGAVESELLALDKEELYYEVVEQEALAEHGIALTLATLQCTLPAAIAFEKLPEHSPDHQYIASHFRSGSASSASDATDCLLLQVFRFFHQGLVSQFHTSDEDGTAIIGSRHGQGLATYLYCAVSEDDAMAVLQHGFQATDDQWLVLFSDPYQALMFDPGSVHASNASNQDAGSVHASDQDPVPPRIRSHLLLLCQVEMHDVRDVTLGGSPSSLPSIVSLAVAAAAVPAVPASASPSAFIHTTLANQSGDLYITSRARGCSASVLPAFVLLCSQRLVSVSPPTASASVSLSPDRLLSSYRREVDRHVQQHHERLWRGEDPSHQLDLQCQLDGTNRAINEEKKTQRQRLQSARNNPRK